MTIYSWNINGYQTCDKYGGFSQILEMQPDIICLQEVKIGNPTYLNNLFTFSYEQYYNFALDKGHNGVYVYSKKKALNCYNRIKFDRFDQEGRFLCLEFGDYILINVYMPHGGRDKKNLQYKIDSYYHLIDFLETLKDEKVILVGDFNIAHSDLDVERYKNNENNIMFTTQEREIFTRLLDLGYIDAYRHKNQKQRQYTWWPYAFDARNRNVGWRIDYCLVSRNCIDIIEEVKIVKEILGSDHCPIRVQLTL